MKWVCVRWVCVKWVGGCEMGVCEVGVCRVCVKCSHQLTDCYFLLDSGSVTDNPLLLSSVFVDCNSLQFISLVDGKCAVPTMHVAMDMERSQACDG